MTWHASETYNGDLVVFHKAQKAVLFLFHPHDKKNYLEEHRNVFSHITAFSSNLLQHFSFYFYQKKKIGQNTINAVLPNFLQVFLKF